MSAPSTPDAIRNTQVFAIIGHDSADGVMKLNSSDEWDSGDGAATIQWPSLRSYPHCWRVIKSSKNWLQKSGSGARPLPSPMWRLLPEKLDYLFGGATGPLLTVHPLGGCPMGDDATCGVVDDCGRVFDASGSASGCDHEGLVVLDGSIVPASLGINPALTIATLALRAIGVLRMEWDYNERRRRREHRQSPLLQATGSGRAGQGHADRSDRTAVGSGGHQRDESTRGIRMSN